ncbi:helix-turn-helix transcriptional regulator [Quadrisphaera sp. KR29]|uniref:helix-turn-helix transcriptional regulator n=1 Tax=Quadrisphaera sp. KR29 TaxID=3461391 RepID=UPI0040440AE0
MEGRSVHTEDLPTPPVRTLRFASADEPEIVDFIERVYVDNSTRFSASTSDARFSAAVCDTDALGAQRVRSTLDYSGTSQDGFAESFLTNLVNSGTVDITSRHVSSTASTGQVTAFPIDFTAHQLDATNLRLPMAAIRACAEEMTGLPGEQLRFHALTPLTPAMDLCWAALTITISGALAETDSPLASPLLAEQMSRTAAMAALHVFPNTTMDHHHRAGPGEVRPAALRRAVAYLEAHADRPVTLSQVAAACGVSTRALQYAFRRHLGTTPLGHLRRVRIECAHRELRTADPARGDTVAAIAARWGFANAGRFSVAYREVFGVPPSQTLRA